MGLAVRGGTTVNPLWLHPHAVSSIVQTSFGLPTPLVKNPTKGKVFQVLYCVASFFYDLLRTTCSVVCTTLVCRPYEGGEET